VRRRARGSFDDTCRGHNAGRIVPLTKNNGENRKSGRNTDHQKCDDGDDPKISRARPSGPTDNGPNYDSDHGSRGSTDWTDDEGGHKRERSAASGSTYLDFRKRLGEDRHHSDQSENKSQ
jgi:hypothetical protein